MHSKCSGYFPVDVSLHQDCPHRECAHNKKLLNTTGLSPVFTLEKPLHMPLLQFVCCSALCLLDLQIISTALGYVLPNLISRQATQHAATALYTFFGMRLLWIAWRSKPQASNQDEVEEIEAKLEASEQQPRTKLQRMLNRLCTPVFLEALILTFLAGRFHL